MKELFPARQPFQWFWFLLLPLILLTGGCKEKDGPPVALPIDTVPAALEKAFSKADAATKDLTSKVIQQIKAPDYPAAYVGLQSLLSRSGLTKEQRNVTAGTLLTVNYLLQQAQTQGDQSASDVLTTYRKNK